MSDDLVKRLREPGVGSARWVLVERPLLVAAADLIEAQAARIAQLEATLRELFDAEMDAIVQRVVGVKVAGGKDE
jgi:hypothetical protein